MILGPDGKPAVEADDAWRARALMSWLDDRKIREMCVKRGIFDLRYLSMILGPILHELLKPGRKITDREAGGLRENTLRILRDRTIRRMIAALVFGTQRVRYAEYQRDLDVWRVEASGDPPQEPQRPQTRHEIMAALRADYEELAERARSEALVVRP